MLVSQDQEIAMGKQAAAEVPAAYGLYGDDALRSYVAGIGHRLAKVSERPELPWSFEVVDDASVNAFALPGGFIYVTRGLLSHLDSEAELAMVLGHEIGHVTARHSASQMSQQQLAMLGFGIGMVVVPELQPLADVGQAGLGLLFLKFGRDDENQSDELGLRYTQRLGYDPAAGARAMDMLHLLSQQEPAGRLPGWLSTHPDPGDRYQRLVARIREQGLRGETVNRTAYLQRIDGLTFGEDPREGFFRGDAFYHPELRFELRLPRGYQRQNTKQAVVATSPQGDGIVRLTMANARSAREAATAFAQSGNVTPSDIRRRDWNGLTAFAGGFQATSRERTPVSGVVAFVELGGRVYQLLGYTAGGSWSRYGRTITDSVQSFAPLRDPKAAEARPRRLEIVTPPRDMTIEEFVGRYPSTVPAATVALVNQVRPGELIRGASPAKRIVGGQGLPALEGPDRP
jgi:predicted Zn-dependent protease